MQRKLLRYLTGLTCLFFANSLYAAPGDTTWVQAQNNINLDFYNNFDAPVTFPSGTVTYRKIIMEFTLGKYQCDASAQYCGDWDYTIQNLLVTGTGDQYELGRLISPYANASYPRTPWAWKQHYYFEVTDFAALLKNNNTIRIFYQGYSGGFTASIRFAFIEGAPARTVTGITKLYAGSFDYGNTTSIESNLPAVSITPPANTQSSALRFLVTGHGSDGNLCSEFCSKYYQVKQNGSVIAQKSIWKDDCGSNQLYPQSGTWIYDRANWCPGEMIPPIYHTFPNSGTGSNYVADIDFEPYTKSGTNTPSYIISAYMVHYGAYNKSLDASVERIVSPTNDENYFRSNPTCSNPVIKIKNTGATTITTVSFQYFTLGQPVQTYTATGLNLASGQETDVTLPALTTLMNIVSGSKTFTVNVTAVNGTADNDAYNNTMSAVYTEAPDWPSSFIISLRSNNFPAQNYWKLENLSGVIVAQRTPTAALTFYNDPIQNLSAGCYKLTVTDSECDGLYWWGNSSSTGLGAFFAQTSDQSAIIPFTNGLPAVIRTSTGYSVPTASQDFGCGFTQYFRVGAVLPLDLLSFTGKADENNVNHLYWKTAKEVNTSHFEVEYAVDAVHYQPAFRVAAAGNTSGTTDYSGTHVPQEKADKYYYRLKMVDKDGSFKYSLPVVLTPTFASFVVAAVTPNPFTTAIRLNITTTKAQAMRLNLFDAQGKLYQTQESRISKGINNISMGNVGALGKGVYLLEIISEDGQKQTRKLIKD